MRPFSQLLKILLKTGFVSITLLSYQSVAMSRASQPISSQQIYSQKIFSQQTPENKEFQSPPPPPGTPPDGRVQGGGRRGNCPAVATQLTAIMPSIQSGNFPVWGYTTKEHPTLWFYVPYTKADGFKTELNLEATKSITVPVTLPNKPGIIGVTVPKTVPALGIDEQYTWTFSIKCDEISSSKSPVYVKGVVRRINIKPNELKKLEAASLEQKVRIYAKNGIWQDTMTALFQLRQKNPRNTSFLRDWEKMLTSIGRADVAKQPLVSIQ
jgi:hypothetical protein